MKKIFYLFVIFCLASTVYSQNKDYSSNPHWIEMMKDKDANFFETQKAFNEYIKNKDKSKVYGHKQFKRWEWFMKTRINEKGELPSPTKVLDNYKAFVNKNGITFNNSDWENLGPIELPFGYISSPTGLGRINTIGFHPFNEKELLIGSPSGGLWKTIDKGENWECLSDDFPTLGVSAIAYDPNNPLIIYIGTGDRDGHDAPGLGIMKSEDGGISWRFINDGIGEITISKIMVHPANTSIIYAAADEGFYRSDNSGEDWRRYTTGEILDFQLKPNDPETIYIAKYGSFSYSNDGGSSWHSPQEIINGYRMVIAVSEANPNYVYALTTNRRTFKAFYFSDNSGFSFELMSDTPNIMGRNATGSDDDGQAWYDLCLVADKNNPDVVYAGGIQMWKSYNKGVNWELIAHDKYPLVDNVHVDHHFLETSPISGDIYVGNDGGIYYTSNEGETWNDISSGLAISQIYKMGQSATLKDMIMCGYQDNSTTIYRNGNWVTVIGADGMECLIDYADTSYKYGSIQYGSIRRSYEPNHFEIIGGTGVNGITESGNWVTPFTLHSTNPEIMFAGYYNLWRTKNVRDANYNIQWERISNNLENSNSSYIVDIEQSSVNSNILYMSREDGKIFRSDNINDHSPQWTSISTISNFYQVNDIEAHPIDENIVYCVKSNGRVFKSINKGDTWSGITYNLPRISINAIVYDKTSNEGLYIGSDAGIYYKDAAMDEWILFTNNFPVSAEVTELEIFYDNENREKSRLRTSTYGRGLWSSPLYEYTEDNLILDASIEEFDLPDDSISIFYEITPKVKIKNTGNDTIQSFEVQLLLNNDTIQTEIVNQEILPQLDYNFEFEQVSATHGKHIFEVNILNVNEIVDDDISNNNMLDSLKVNRNNYLKLSFISDDLASETSWEIKQEEETIYASPTYIDGTNYDTIFHYNLEAGCYTLYVYDEGSNGICCENGSGEIVTWDYAMDTIYAVFDSFSDIDSIEFCIDDIDLPFPSFYVQENTLCLNDDIVIADSSIGTITAYHWNFGTGADKVSSNLAGDQIVQYKTPGQKNVSVTLTNQYGSITETIDGYIEILPFPSIVSQSNLVINKCTEDSVKIYVDAEYYDSLQWFRIGSSIEYDEDFFIINNLTSDHSGKYYCELYSKCDTITSDTIELIVNPLPDVTISTESTQFCLGDEIILTASGADTYTWSNTNENTSQITISPTSSNQYSVIGTNSSSGCQDIAYIALNMLIEPTLTTDIKDSSYCYNENVVLYVGAQGNSLNFEWTKDEEAIPDVNSPFLMLDNFGIANVGNYNCRVYNQCAEVFSTNAEINIDTLPTADFIYEINDYVVSFTSINENATYYYWAFGDNSFSDEENPTHDYLRSGNFNVLHRTINQCGTSELSKGIEIWAISVPEINAQNELTIYPNPNNGEFNIIFDKELRNANIKIYSLEGKLIKQLDQINEESNQPIKLDLTNFENGIYFVYLYSANEYYYSKIYIHKN